MRASPLLVAALGLALLTPGALAAQTDLFADADHCEPADPNDPVAVLVCCVVNALLHRPIQGCDAP